MSRRSGRRSGRMRGSRQLRLPALRGSESRSREGARERPQTFDLKIFHFQLRRKNMFPAIATLMAAGHGFAAIVALMGLGALGFAVETYSGTNYGADDSLLGTFGPYVDAFMGGVEYTAGGAIGQTQGSVLLHGSSALAMTLAAPVAGTPANGGNDFQKLDIFADSTGAHT